MSLFRIVFFFQAEDGIRDVAVTGVQTCALPIFLSTAFNCGAPCVPVATRIVTSRDDMPASRKCLRRNGITRATGVGRFRSSIITKGRDFPRQICRIGDCPLGRSRASEICASVSGGGVGGRKTVTSHSGGKSRVRALSEYHTPVQQCVSQFMRPEELDPGHPTAETPMGRRNSAQTAFLREGYIDCRSAAKVDT